jgi:O-antigen/teichoic acid export membrane protein
MARFYPLFKAGDMQGLTRQAIKATRIMMSVAIPMVLVCSLGREFLMGLYGPEYVVHSQILLVLLLPQLIKACTGPVGYLLILTEYHSVYRNIILVSSLIFVVLVATLGVEYGVMGVAVSVAVSLCFTNILAALLVKQKLGINILQALNPGYR